MSESRPRGLRFEQNDGSDSSVGEESEVIPVRLSDPNSSTDPDRNHQADPVDAYMNQLTQTLLREDYDALIEQLEHSTSVLNRDEDKRSLGMILGTACYQKAVPLQVYQLILSDAPTAALYQDAGLRTPLHMVIMCTWDLFLRPSWVDLSSHAFPFFTDLDRPDLVETLVSARPQCIHLQDMELLRPIDILTQKLLMKEERFRYLGERRTREDEQALADNWECARLLVIAHGETSDGVDYRNLPLVHACLRALQYVPLALIARAIRRQRAQLQVTDDVVGNLPLHWVAQSPAGTDGDDLLAEVLEKHIGAALMRNFHNQWPVNVAIEAGRRWDSGVSILLDANPLALEDFRILDGRQLPLMAERLGRTFNRPSLVYALLKTHIELFVA